MSVGMEGEGCSLLRGAVRLAWGGSECSPLTRPRSAAPRPVLTSGSGAACSDRAFHGLPTPHN